MKIWLIRHGSTRPGEEKRYQGRLDEGLSEKGREDLLRADRAFPRVFGMPGTDRQPAAGKGSCMESGAPFFPGHVYTSPALRARQTARILFPRARQIIVPGLGEMDFGIFEGRGWLEMEEDPDYRRWVDGGCAGRCPGGEDRASFSERVCRAFDGILVKEAGVNADQTESIRERQVVIVAHGGTQMALLEKRGRPPRGYYDWQTPCGCGWLLETEKTGSLHVVEKVCFAGRRIKENTGI